MVIKTACFQIWDLAFSVDIRELQERAPCVSLGNEKSSTDQTEEREIAFPFPFSIKLAFQVEMVVKLEPIAPALDSPRNLCPQDSVLKTLSSRNLCPQETSNALR